MVGRRVMVLVGAAALVAPLTGGTAMPAAASGGSPAATPSAVPASSCFPSDNGDPVLKTLSITPRELDSRTGAKVVTLTATAEDTGGPGSPSGVTDATAYLELGGGDSWTLMSELTPDSSGSLVGTVTVLPQQRTGTWNVTINVRDAAENSTTYGPEDLQRLGLPGTLTTTTTPDEARPALKSLSVSTSTVDTRRRSRSVAVSVRATDDVAVAGVHVFLSGLQGRLIRANLELASGTAQDGTWRGRLVVGRWKGRSTGQLGVQVTDAVERSRWYGSAALARKGQPSRLKVISLADQQRPTPQIVSVTPAAVDLRGGPQPVQVVARVRDVGSGVRQVVARLDGPGNWEGYASLRVPMSRTSGTSRDGVWTGTLTMRPCDAPAGVWQAAVLAKDAVRKRVVRLAGAFTVVNTDVRRPTALVTGRSWQVGRSGPLAVEFHEDVVGVDAANTLVHIGDGQRGQAGDNPPPIAGSWACKDAAGVSVDCTAGPVRTAAFTPTSPMNASTNHTLVLNPEHHLGLTDLAGNPYNPRWSLEFRTA